MIWCTGLFEMLLMEFGVENKYAIGIKEKEIIIYWDCVCNEKMLSSTMNC